MSNSKRETVVVELGDFVDKNLPDISDPFWCQIAVKVPFAAHPVDIGSWAFSSKSRVNSHTASREFAIYEVDLDSFVPERIDFIRRFITTLALDSSLGKRANTLANYFRVVRRFVDRCTGKKAGDLSSMEDVSKGYQLWAEETEEASTRSVRDSVRVLRLLLLRMYSDAGVDLDYKLWRMARNPVIEPERKVSEEEVDTFLVLINQLFTQLTPIVLESKPFPFELRTLAGNFWYFPIDFSTKVRLQKRSDNSPQFESYAAYDYENGKLRSVDDIVQLLDPGPQGLRRLQARRASYCAAGAVEEANAMPFHRKRVAVAELATECFIFMFVAATGMNTAQVTALPWDEKYTTERYKPSFKIIKYRAGNREVEFIVGNNFLKAFKKYLEIRAFILRACKVEHFPWLFLYAKHRKMEVGPVVGNHLSERLKESLKSSFDFDGYVGLRDLRASKVNWLLKYEGIDTAAKIAQHSKSTLVRNYSKGTAKATVTEISEYLKNYSSVLITERKTGQQVTAVGACHSLDDPKKIPGSSFSADCRSLEGCLFCENYRAHGDFEDIRKLLSFKYVISRSRVLSRDDEEFDQLYEPIVNRIDNIIAEISTVSKYSSSQVNDVREDVFERENLSMYWAAKLDLLTELEVF